VLLAGVVTAPCVRLQESENGVAATQATPAHSTDSMFSFIVDGVDQAQCAQEPRAKLRMAVGAFLASAASCPDAS
jgi:hypothetical protein